MLKSCRPNGIMWKFWIGGPSQDLRWFRFHHQQGWAQRKWEQARRKPGRKMGKNFGASWNSHKEAGHLTIKIICIRTCWICFTDCEPWLYIDILRRIGTVVSHNHSPSWRSSVIVSLSDSLRRHRKVTETVTGYEGSQGIIISGIQLRTGAVCKQESNHC